MARMPEGRYKGRVIGQALTEVGTTPCFELMFWVTHVLGAAGWAAAPTGGVRRNIRLWLTKDGLVVTRRAMEQLGTVPESIRQLNPFEMDAVVYTGREVELECVHREYEEQLREDWNIARPSPTPLSAERIAELDAQLGPQLKSESEVATVVASEEAPDAPVPY